VSLILRRVNCGAEAVCACYRSTGDSDNSIAYTVGTGVLFMGAQLSKQ
jgi:hypothetical protein